MSSDRVSDERHFRRQYIDPGRDIFRQVLCCSYPATLSDEDHKAEICSDDSSRVAPGSLSFTAPTVWLESLPLPEGQGYLHGALVQSY